MGKRGPKPTPTATLARRGSWRGNARDGEPTPETLSEAPPCPAHLVGEAAELWREEAPKMVGTGTLTVEDLRAFERYCRTYALWRKLMAQMEAAEVVDAAVVRSLQKVDDSLRRLEAAFGKTPADRANLKLPDTPKPDAQDPFRKPKIHAV